MQRLEWKQSLEQRHRGKMDLLYKEHRPVFCPEADRPGWLSQRLRGIADLPDVDMLLAVNLPL